MIERKDAAARATDIAAHKDQLVEGMFDQIASRYDLLNDVMTFGMHRLWKTATLRALGNRRHASVLDVATGTGDLALALTATSRTARVVGLDFSAAMLARARARQQRLPATHQRLTFLHGDALALPFADRAFSATTAGFALRNVANLGRMFRELARVLGSGGRVALLDLVPLAAPLPWTRLVTLHLRYVVPRLGPLLGSDSSAYAYLPTSVQTIPVLPAIEELLREAGFVDVRHRLFGLGAVALISGTRR